MKRQIAAATPAQARIEELEAEVSRLSEQNKDLQANMPVEDYRRIVR
jgi:cell division protein FtsB